MVDAYKVYLYRKGYDMCEDQIQNYYYITGKYYLYFGHFYNIKMSCFSLYFFEGCSELDSVAKLGWGLGWELIYFTVRT